IDLDKKEMVLNTWVAHGQRSGNDEAVNFSNKNDSYTSSLGFYVTGEVYRGMHGKSLKLDGMDIGFNNNARMRSIVVHGAPYVSPGTINALGRLGRSQGCPAVAPELADKVINTIEDKTVLFINKTKDDYTSKYLDHTLAANFALENATF
ncbi:MAG: murein L,D-transpeptidase catalytic domain family protein, partial [Chitinophagaceae bacterium]